MSPIRAHHCFATSGRADAGQEYLDLAGQLFGLLGEVGGRRQHQAGGTAGFVGGNDSNESVG